MITQTNDERPETSADIPPGNPAIPAWKSHKVVRGDRIVHIDMIPADQRLENFADTGFRWRLACGVVIAVFPALIARGGPQPGDYYVEYEDGHKSWSPAAAFESGYVRLA